MAEEVRFCRGQFLAAYSPVKGVVRGLFVDFCRDGVAAPFVDDVGHIVG